MEVFYTAQMFPEETDPNMKMTGIYSKVDGGYVGTAEYAAQLTARGICPQRASLEHNVCSIGYQHLEKKWYGWSHRAMAGFGIGSSVAAGDCAYVPTDWDDFIVDAVRFWDDETHDETQGARTTDDQGVACVEVRWRYPDTIPNAKLHGTWGSAMMYPPAQFGRGAWTAETMQDAKQMAMDFAEGVS
jgi:hypothetical protein